MKTPMAESPMAHASEGGAPRDGAREEGRRLAPPRPSSSSLRLWLWVGGLVLFMGLLWAAMFTAARQAHIESVPLATPGGKP